MNKNNDNPKKKNIWSDLPRRFATVSVGLPIVCQLLSYPITAHLFFVGVHAIACWEWTSLMINGTNKKIDNNNKSIPNDGDDKANEKKAYRIWNHPLFFCATSLSLAWIESDPLFLFSLCLTSGCLIIVSLVDSDGTVADPDDTMIQKRRPEQDKTTKQFMMTLLGYMVLTIPMRAWYIIGDDFPSTVSLLLTVWNCDTGALIGGRLVRSIVGLLLPAEHERTRKKDDDYDDKSSSTHDQSHPRRLLLPMPEWILQISPAKSMEGFVGGIIGGCLTTVFLVPWMFDSLSLLSSLSTTSPVTSETSSSVSFSDWWIGLLLIAHNGNDAGATDTNKATAAFVSLWLDTTPFEKLSWGVIWSLLAIAGDLMESAVKRRASIKDSGKLLPGMGGILDRFDSSLLAVLLYRYILQSQHNQM